MLANERRGEERKGEKRSSDRGQWRVDWRDGCADTDKVRCERLGQLHQAGGDKTGN